jgi:hypothetical protein
MADDLTVPPIGAQFKLKLAGSAANFYFHLRSLA